MKIMISGTSPYSMNVKMMIARYVLRKVRGRKWE